MPQQDPDLTMQPAAAIRALDAGTVALEAVIRNGRDESE